MWLRTSPLNAGGFQCEEGAFAVQLLEPWLIVAIVDAAVLHATIIVYHAPHANRRDERRKGLLASSHWQRLADIIENLSSKDRRLILLGDANATVGSRITASIGSHAVESEGECGGLFRDFLLQHDLWLPATFEHTTEGIRQQTWRSPDGETEHRIDYIV